MRRPAEGGPTAAPTMPLSPPPLRHRRPSTADLRVFTTEMVPGGRHRVQPGRVALRVVRDGVRGGAVLRPVLAGLGPR